MWRTNGRMDRQTPRPWLRRAKHSAIARKNRKGSFVKAVDWLVKKGENFHLLFNKTPPFFTGRKLRPLGIGIEATASLISQSRIQGIYRSEAAASHTSRFERPAADKLVRSFFRKWLQNSCPSTRNFVKLIHWGIYQMRNNDMSLFVVLQIYRVIRKRKLQNVVHVFIKYCPIFDALHLCCIERLWHDCRLSSVVRLYVTDVLWLTDNF